MQKSKLVESVRQLVLRQQPTQDSLKSVHPAVIEAEISKAYNTVLKQFYSSDANLMDYELEFYAKKYTFTLIPESYTETNIMGEESTVYTGKKYITLTARPVELKRNLGIRSVRPKYGDMQFVRTSENEMDTIRELEVYCCLKQGFYWLDGSNLMFEFSTTDLNNVEEVQVKMLPLFEDLADTDNIEFPGGETAGMQMILNIMGIRPTDNTNDEIR